MHSGRQQHFSFPCLNTICSFGEMFFLLLHSLLTLSLPSIQYTHKETLECSAVSDHSFIAGSLPHGVIISTDKALSKSRPTSLTHPQPFSILRIPQQPPKWLWIHTPSVRIGFPKSNQRRGAKPDFRQPISSFTQDPTLRAVWNPDGSLCPGIMDLLKGSREELNCVSVWNACRLAY